MLDFQMDFTQFHQKVLRSHRALDLDVENAVTLAAKHGKERAQEGKFKDRSGKLRATITSTPIGWTGSTFWASFQTNVPYALWVENDTKPHPIDPRGLGYPLHWVGGSFGPGDHFAMHVFHPGTTGFGFMKHAEGWAHAFLVKELSYRLPNLIGVWQ